jgi:glycosyltransferase involved in cell wall biosynthesis
MPKRLDHAELEAPRKDRMTPRSTKKRPTRVCMVTYSFYETDSRVMRYAEALAQRGNKVEVFALRRPGTPPEEQICGVHVHRLQERVFDEQRLFTYGWRTLKFLVKALVRVARRDLQSKFDLVHIHTVPDFLVFSALVPRLRGTPVILDIRDILPEFYSSKFKASKDSLGFRFLCLLERISAKFSSHVIVAGKAWQARLLSRSVEPGRSTVVLNVPDRSIFKRSATSNAALGNSLLLYHGTLNWHQGLDTAIQAFGKIKDFVPGTEFHIYGDGPSKPELLTLIGDLQLQNRVRIFNRIPVREIASILETAQLGIVPKRKDEFGNEAFSTKILEFMAMGVPVIVSNTKVDQAYFDSSLVRFFQAEDVEDLAANMLDLIQHPEKRTALAEQAMKFVAQMDWDTKKLEYYELVERLLKKPEERRES